MDTLRKDASLKYLVAAGSLISSVASLRLVLLELLGLAYRIFLIIFKDSFIHAGW
jgi:hypothetical protein